jgi:NitT/TauT family transport system ATP-binding protein
MPAKGAMQTRLVAPVVEPPQLQGPSVIVDAVTRRFAAQRRGAEPVLALDGMSLTVDRNEVVAVVGPSGCGKSTLLELICGLQRPDVGSVRGEDAVYMPQRDLLLPWADALDNAALALRVAGVGRTDARERALPLFERLGLAGFEHHRPDALSGGMRQRVAVVRTLLAGRPLIALDEPFGALDALTRRELHAWFAGALAAEPRSVVLVTHDVEEAVVLADRVVVMSPRPGRVVAELSIAAPRPRRATEPALVALRERALEALAR